MSISQGEGSGCVCIGEATSAWRIIPAGVPQGSILGPLLFLIYTAALPYDISAKGVESSQFADDTCLVSIPENAPVSADQLQDLVTSTGKWLGDWRLNVNKEKTVVMDIQHIFKRLRIKSSSKPAASWNGYLIGSTLERSHRTGNQSRMPTPWSPKATAQFSDNVCSVIVLLCVHTANRRVRKCGMVWYPAVPRRQARTVSAQSCSRDLAAASLRRQDTGFRSAR